MEKVAEECCTVCGTRFEPQFSYQLQEREEGKVAFCSARCQLRAMTRRDEVRCSACGKAFVPEYAYQMAVLDGRRLHFCTMECYEAGKAAQAPLKKLAVYNLKGGTGKTTTAVNLATALAALGHRILLVDGDPQGSVAVSLGVESRRGLYQVLVLGSSPGSCAVGARPDLDVVLSDRSLAASEVFLAGRPDRHRVMRDRFAGLEGYELVIIDCSPSMGLLSQNALRCADAVLAPVSCDYLGVVGLEQAIQTMDELHERTGHRAKLIGVLPTFYDARLLVCRDSMATMTKRYGDILLPPIRINVNLREAPAHKSSIFEHSPRSTGAEDYDRLGRWFSRKFLSNDDGARSGTSLTEAVDTARPSETGITG